MRQKARKAKVKPVLILLLMILENPLGARKLENSVVSEN